MWTYTSYILDKYCERKGGCAELRFEDLYYFIFKVLWLKKQLVFHDGMKDLLLDLEYLKKLDVITFEEKDDAKKIVIKIKNREALSNISQIVEDSATLAGVNLFGEYKKRIDEAIMVAP